MRCKNHGGLPASISGHDDTRLCDVCEYGRDLFLDGPETITIPRNLYELYKEAAEKWAREQIGQNGTPWLNMYCSECTKQIYLHDDTKCGDHAADCKAARILNLERE